MVRYSIFVLPKTKVMFMKRYNALLIIVWTLFALSGCETRTQEEPKTVQTVRLGIAKQPSDGLLMIAKERGFFQKHGLNIEVTLYPSGKRALQEGLLENRSDVIGSTEVPVIKNRLDGGDPIVFATIFTAENVNRIAARRDAGIERPEMLRGKRIATQCASAVHFFLHLFLLEHGVSEEDVTISCMQAEELAPALHEKTIDAFSMREPYIGKAVDLEGENALVFDAPGIYRQMELVVTSRAFAAANPQSLEKIVAALLDAELYAEEHHEEAVSIISRWIGAEPGDVETIWQSSRFNIALDQSMLILMEEISRWFIAEKLTTAQRVPNFLDSVDTVPLEKLRPQSITIMQ